MYVLLRKSEDATPLDAVTLPHDPSEPEETVPLVGIPAAERREEELTSTPEGDG